MKTPPTLIVNPNNLYLTSDQHFNHINILQYCDRPWSTIEEMNATLIENWNKVVPTDGIVYSLGDFSFSDPTEFLKQLNGRIVLFKGNHDKWKTSKVEPLKNILTVVPYNTALDIKVEDEELDTGYMYFTLSHFAMLSWNKKNFGAVNLHGHSHGTPNHNLLKPLPALDVGVDVKDYKPFSYQNIKTILTKQLMRK